jgi:hypothetical protein
MNHSIFLPDLTEGLNLHPDIVRSLLNVCSRVFDLCNQDVAGSNLSKLVHDNGNLLPWHHDRDGDPAALLERSNGGCAVSGCNPAGIVELHALDVVCAEDVLLRGCLLLAC